MNKILNSGKSTQDAISRPPISAGPLNSQHFCQSLKKGRFWITPDPYHKDDNIQIGREVKISCQVEAVPSEELTFSWFKNGRPLRSSERMVITQTDPDVSPGTTNLDIIDLKFTDFGTYTCVASLKGGGISDISIDVNISSSTGKNVGYNRYRLLD
ncbi:hypothetical protein FD755_013260 [Muntiacus reevesi]|uniref:Ig-like domain-containing protein n=1 Tax=Muntiacus reevesi TaxID=9886 RepID=A0A5N3XMA1_MUNRE|nr:hypothetical protein FD755_013260 [Muntiacus reevesi]